MKVSTDVRSVSASSSSVFPTEQAIRQKEAKKIAREEATDIYADSVEFAMDAADKEFDQ